MGSEAFFFTGHSLYTIFLLDGAGKRQLRFAQWPESWCFPVGGQKNTSYGRVMQHRRSTKSLYSTIDVTHRLRLEDLSRTIHVTQRFRPKICLGAIVILKWVFTI